MSRLSVKNVTVAFNGMKAVNHVSFDLGGGTLAGLIGPNGAGKTTLLRAIANLIPFNGRICLDGEDVTSITRSSLAKQISYLAQGHICHWPLQVRHVVALGRHPHLPAFGRLSSMDEQIIADVMVRADVGQFAERNVLTLSGGERARVMLARALVGGGQLLLADEPVASLDPFHKLQIMDLLKALAAAGQTVVVVTHDLTLAARFCDQLILLCRGKIIAQGDVDNVLSDEAVAEAYHVDLVRAQHKQTSYVLPWQRV